MSPSAAPPAEERLVRTFCRPNCFGGCPVYAHVRDGKVVKTSMAPLPDPRYNRICLRGLTQPQQMYSDRRILHPMRRVGERGSGEWEQISWDEAIDVVVEKFSAIREQYGSRAIAYTQGSGNFGVLSGSMLGATARFFAALEGTTLGNTLDVAQEYGIQKVFGLGPQNDPADLVNAKTIFIVGSNMTEAQIHTWHFVADAIENGTKVIVIDPVYTATAAKAHQWVRIRPGSDGALFLAMVRYILAEGLENTQYVQDHTVAPFLVRGDDGEFLRRSHVTGQEPGETTHPLTGAPMPDDPYMVWSLDEDRLVEAAPGVRAAMTGSHVVEGVTVTPALDLLKDAVSEWTPEHAEEVTTIPAATIVELARTYATATPATIYHCMGIDHWDNAHQTTFAESTLAAITGNIGIPGGTIGFKWYYGENLDFMAWLFPGGRMAKDIYTDDMFSTARTGQIMGEPYPVKALYVAACNPLGAYCDRNTWVNEVLPSLDFIVSVDIYTSDTTEYSDLVLPAAHWFERTDMQFANNHPFIMWGEKAVEPLGESKADIDILRLLAPRLGIGEFFDMSDEELLELSMSKPWAERLGITVQAVKEQGAIKVWYQDPERPNIGGGVGGVFFTESTRAEFYNPHPHPRVPSTTSMSYHPKTEHLPTWSSPLEAWPTSPTAKKYPLVFFQEHTRWRVHTQYAEVPWLRELDPVPTVKLNPDDAAERGIVAGDDVEIYNDRGHVVVEAVISSALPRGMVSLPKGWLAHQHKVGAPSELTHMTLNPASVNQSYFDVGVEVRVWKGQD